MLGYVSSALPCHGQIYSLLTLDVSPGCAAWRHAGSGRKWTAEFHRQRSDSRAVSPGCKLQEKVGGVEVNICHAG